MPEANYGITGDEIIVEVGGSKYRAYSFSINRGAAQIEARAFEDEAAFSPVVTSSKFTDITLNFRKPPVAPMNTTVVISVALDGGTAKVYNAKVTGTVKAGTVDGVVDYSFTARALPAA